jgi:hypothetical protein
MKYIPHLVIKVDYTAENLLIHGKAKPTHQNYLSYVG